MVLTCSFASKSWLGTGGLIFVSIFIWLCSVGFILTGCMVLDDSMYSNSAEAWLLTLYSWIISSSYWPLLLFASSRLLSPSSPIESSIKSSWMVVSTLFSISFMDMGLPLETGGCLVGSANLVAANWGNVIWVVCTVIFVSASPY